MQNKSGSLGQLCADQQYLPNLSVQKRTFRKLRKLLIIENILKKLHCKRGDLKPKWELSSNKRRAVLWKNRRDFIYNASRAELVPLYEATSMADGLFQQGEESKYLKIEQAAFRDCELKGFKNQTGNRIRLSLTFIQTLRICASVKFKTCTLSGT